MADSSSKPKTDLYVYFSNFEEIGHGVSLSEDWMNSISIDIGLAACRCHGDEKGQYMRATAEVPCDFVLRKNWWKRRNKLKPILSV